MPGRRVSLLCALACALTFTALLPGSAAAAIGNPVIDTPALSSDPADFGGLLNVSIGNSDPTTLVVGCVSSRCIWLFPASLGPIPINDNAYTATGNDFGLDFRHGQRRTVVIYAANGESHSRWGPTVLTVY